MDKIKYNIGKIVISLCEIACGVLLLINHYYFNSIIIIGAGIVMTVSGIISIVNYFRAEPTNTLVRQNFSKGLIGIIFGLFCVFSSNFIILTFDLVMPLLYGAAMLVVGVVKIQWTVDLMRAKLPRWWITGLSAAITVIFAVIVLCNPFGTSEFVWSFIGITLICSAVCDIIALIIRPAPPTETIEVEAKEVK